MWNVECGGIGGVFFFDLRLGLRLRLRIEN